MISVTTWVIAEIHYWKHHWTMAIGPGVGVTGIMVAIIIRSGAGTQELSPEEEQAVRAARTGQGLPAAERVGHREVTVRTRRPLPAT